MSLAIDKTCMWNNNKSEKNKSHQCNIILDCTTNLKVAGSIPPWLYVNVSLCKTLEMSFSLLTGLILKSGIYKWPDLNLRRPDVACEPPVNNHCCKQFDGYLSDRSKAVCSESWYNTIVLYIACVRCFSFSV